MKNKSTLEKLTSYTLAIPTMPQEYKRLQLGALYWVAIEESELALKLVGQTLAGVEALGKAVLLAHTNNELEDVLAYLSKPDGGPATLHSYRMKTVSLHTLQRLPKQIDKALKPVERLIVLLLPLNERAVWQEHAGTLLRAWRNWAESNSCTLLVVSYGANAQALTHDLYIENNSLSGLAVMRSAQGAVENEFVYEVSYWRSGLGVKGNERFKLRNTETFLKLILDPKTQEPTVVGNRIEKKNELVFERDVLEGTPITLTDNWQVVDSWAELIEKGLSTASPVLIFALNSSEDLEGLARILYRLRQQRSDAVKIVVREMHQALRKQEVNLLNSCGASLVVPEGTQLARFFSLLETVIKQPSVYQLTDNLEQAIAAVRPQQIRGVLASLAFCDYVDGLLTELPVDGFAGVLVVLRPVPMLSAEMVVSQINLTRMGDVACAANNEVYLFLFGCTPNFATVALQRVLKLPFSELIIEDKVYAESASIEEQVLRLRRYHAPRPKMLKINKGQDHESNSEEKPRFQPVLKPLTYSN